MLWWWLNFQFSDFVVFKNVCVAYKSILINISNVDYKIFLLPCSVFILRVFDAKCDSRKSQGGLAHLLNIREEATPQKGLERRNAKEEKEGNKKSKDNNMV